MPWKYNPFTDALDQTGSGGGTSYIDGDVEYHADLPVTVGTPAVNSAFLVRKGQGLYFLTRKPAGIWVRELNNGNLDDWKYAGTFSDIYRDANFRIINDADTSKQLAFSLSGLATGTTSTLTVPASGTIARTEDFASPPSIGSTTPAAGTFTTLRIGSTSTFEAGIGKPNLGVMGFNRQDSPSSYHFAIGFDGTNQAAFCSGTAFFGWANANASSVSACDVRLFRDAADTLAQRRAANPQTFRLYGQITGTDVSATGNYERGFMRWSAAGGVFQIGTEKGSGGGSARALEFQTDGTSRWQITTGGLLSTVSLPADSGGFGLAGGWITYRAGSTNHWAIVEGAITQRATGNFQWSGQSDASNFSGDWLRLSRSAGGCLLLSANTSTEHRLQFGGTTTSFPALKRSSTVLQARLANDSDFCPLQGQLRIHQNAVSETITATHTLTLYDAAGTAYKVPCVAA